VEFKKGFVARRIEFNKRSAESHVYLRFFHVRQETSMNEGNGSADLFREGHYFRRIVNHSMNNKNFLQSFWPWLGLSLFAVAFGSFRNSVKISKRI
jgi:hypothetical protein